VENKEIISIIIIVTIVTAIFNSLGAFKNQYKEDMSIKSALKMAMNCLLTVISIGGILILLVIAGECIGNIIN